MVMQILPLSVRNASVTKRSKTLIGPIEMEIAETGFTIIMGPNGAGKTTLLKMLHGLESPSKGSLDWNSDIETARLNQAYVFQTPIMLRRTAAENIVYPLRLRGISKAQAKREAQTWLEKINLADASTMNARLLSGGEKQKLALARSLAIKPQLLFLDEPTANLDGRATREIESILKDARASGMRIIMTTHDKGQAKRLAEDIVFLYQGKIHESGEATSFFNKQTTAEARAFLEGDIVE